MRFFVAILFWSLAAAASAQSLPPGFLAQQKPVVSGGGGSQPFITGQAVGTLRNDYGNYVGFQFRASQNSHITAIGRWIVSGNSQSHTLMVTDASCTTLGSVTLNTSGQTAGQYAYVALSSPLAITAGSSYNVLSLEIMSGDQWYNNDTTVTANAAEGTVTQDEYVFSGSCSSANDANTSYGPVNFQFSTP